MDKPRILIIDDPNLRKTFSDILRIKGYRTLTAEDGEKGLRVLREDRVNLVLIDLGLPGIPGLEVLARVKADFPLTGAIVLTGQATIDSAVEATNWGAFSYLVKPYEIDQLVNHIRRALEKQQAEEEIAQHHIELERMNAELKTLREISEAISQTLDKSLMSLLSSQGNQIGIAVNNSRLYEETKSVSLHDPLTGLANRRFLDIQLEKIYEPAKRYGQHQSVIMLDIDHFKRYNDTHGHQGGDLLLRLANILTEQMRKSDYVFRYGGEEFLVPLPDTALSMARDAAEKLRAAAEREAGITISLGVTTYRDGMPDKETLVKEADAALYRAKEGGRNRVETAGYET